MISSFTQVLCLTLTWHEHVSDTLCLLCISEGNLYIVYKLYKCTFYSSTFIWQLEVQHKTDKTSTALISLHVNASIIMTLLFLILWVALIANISAKLKIRSQDLFCWFYILTFTWVNYQNTSSITEMCTVAGLALQ